ncbi:hypothetical protein [Azospirillum sp. B2RO_4]|uniref:hypothetical protein n=1 Tax=Azospirillum sp. B2RO_4 TaxID=3027796 RepID=UPI003DAA49DD
MANIGYARVSTAGKDPAPPVPLIPPVNTPSGTRSKTLMNDPGQASGLLADLEAMRYA